MELIPIRTRTLHPPDDDLYSVLITALTDIHERDIIIITSKVVAIHEGRCVRMDEVDKQVLIEQEADLMYTPSYRTKPLTVTHHAFISSAGIDESNGEGYYTLLPKDPFRSAASMRSLLMNHFNLRELGVIISDSHSLPFRYGALSISIGCAGFKPVESHIGRPDLFGRPMEYSKTNIADAIAAAATLVSGECDESQPMQIARGIPNLVFTDDDPRPEFFVPYEEDIYRHLYRDFIPPDAQA